MSRIWKIVLMMTVVVVLVALCVSGSGGSERAVGRSDPGAPGPTTLPPAVPGRRKTADRFERLARFYNECRYFELRDAVAGMASDPSPELDFYRGAVNNAFNRLADAVAGLGRYIDRAKVDSPLPMAKEAWALLADSYRRSGQYRRSAQAQRAILDRFGPGLDAAEKASRENQEALWSALADIPPQTVEILGDSAVRMECRHLPVRVKDRIIHLAYDTGSNLSVLCAAAAEELGLVSFGVGIRIQTTTGRYVDSRVAVVPEMRLGEAVIRNAVFLVMPDDYFPSRRIVGGVERRGLLGSPVLSGLREFTETKDGILLIPASPRLRPEQNMCFFGLMPVVEVLHRGARLSFCLDTGSVETYLHPPYFRRYRGEIQARSGPKTARLGGLGDERTVDLRVLDEFAFKTGDRDIALKKIAVHTEVTHSSTGILFGTIGLDILGQCSRIILNFDSMSFVLE